MHLVDGKTKTFRSTISFYCHIKQTVLLRSVAPFQSQSVCSCSYITLLWSVLLSLWILLRWVTAEHIECAPKWTKRFPTIWNYSAVCIGYMICLQRRPTCRCKVGLSLIVKEHSCSQGLFVNNISRYAKFPMTCFFRYLPKKTCDFLPEIFSGDLF